MTTNLIYMLALLTFKKAFDSVNHKTLFYKLTENKINGNILQRIYKQSQCVSKINNKLTQFFNDEKGVIEEILQAQYSSTICFNK